MTDGAEEYPGSSLGLAASGPGSIATLGRRILALIIDYTAATMIASAFFGFRQWSLPEEAGWTQFAPLAVFAVLQIIFIPTIGGSPGHRILGMRVLRADGGWTGVWRPIVRTLLLVIVIPPAIWDEDRRGLHDRIAGTVLIRV
ncbi:MAG: RDD family protein [Microbacterium sp.]